MSRVASPSRGRSRTRARKSSSSSQRRAKSFEELFNDQNRVAKLRRQYQQKYPKKKVDELVAWLGDARVLCDAGKTLLELQCWDPDFLTDPDFFEMRSKLFESREDLLRRADLPQHVKENAASLDEFLLGQDGVLLVMEEVDCHAAQKQHETWFARLQAATRHSTAMVHALQNLFSVGAKTLLGSDASTAESLTAQWSATDEALIAEEALLGERTALQAVRESVRCALVAAEDLRAYLARSKDEWAQLDSTELLSDHLYTLPDLEHDDPFIKHFQDVLDLPLTAGAIAAGEGLSHAVEIEEENVNVFRVLYQNAHRLQGIVAPVFVVHQGKVWARYFHEGSFSLADFEARYEVDHDALNMVFASVTSAAGSF